MKKAEGAENRRRERRGQHRRPQCESQKRNAANGFRFLGRGGKIGFWPPLEAMPSPMATDFLGTQALIELSSIAAWLPSFASCRIELTCCRFRTKICHRMSSQSKYSTPLGVILGRIR